MAKKTVSIVVPYYEVDLDKPFVLNRLRNSFPPNSFDEFILVWNQAMGYAKAINKGLSLATGDYLCVMNDDLVWEMGSPRDLCKPNTVVSPRINGVSQPFWGCCFCLPRSVYEKVGGLDERYRISYYDDEDYWLTLEQAKIPLLCNEMVDVSHPQGGRTLHSMSDHREFQEENHQKFLAKWGREPNRGH